MPSRVIGDYKTIYIKKPINTLQNLVEMLYMHVEQKFKTLLLLIL